MLKKLCDNWKHLKILNTFYLTLNCIIFRLITNKKSIWSTFVAILGHHPCLVDQTFLQILFFSAWTRTLLFTFYLIISKIWYKMCFGIWYFQMLPLFFSVYWLLSDWFRTLYFVDEFWVFHSHFTWRAKQPDCRLHRTQSQTLVLRKSLTAFCSALSIILDLAISTFAP